MVAALRPGPRLPPVVTNCLLPSEMARGIRGRGVVWRLLLGCEGSDCDRPLTASVTVDTGRIKWIHLDAGGDSRSRAA